MKTCKLAECKTKVEGNISNFCCKKHKDRHHNRTHYLKHNPIFLCRACGKEVKRRMIDNYHCSECNKKVEISIPPKEEDIFIPQEFLTRGPVSSGWNN